MESAAPPRASTVGGSTSVTRGSARREHRGDAREARRVHKAGTVDRYGRRAADDADRGREHAPRHCAQKRRARRIHEAAGGLVGNPDGAAVRLDRHDDARLGVDTPTDDARRTLAPSRPYRDARKARPPRPRREERTAAEAAARGACCRRGLDAMQGSRAATEAAARGARCSRGRSAMRGSRVAAEAAARGARCRRGRCEERAAAEDRARPPRLPCRVELGGAEEATRASQKEGRKRNCEGPRRRRRQRRRRRGGGGRRSCRGCPLVTDLAHASADVGLAARPARRRGVGEVVEGVGGGRRRHRRRRCRRAASSSAAAAADGAAAPPHADLDDRAGHQLNLKGRWRHRIVISW